MKKLFITSLFFLGLNLANAQQTVILKPGAEEGKDAPIFSRYQSGHNQLNDGDHPDFNAMAWTMGGDPNTIRSLI